MDKAKPVEKANLGGFDKFLNKYGLYLIFALVVACIFFIAYEIGDVFPFSTATISTYDYYQQIAPFLEHVSNFFKGETSLFFSRNVMGGADMFQSLCFMMVSPFTIIFLLCGSQNAYIAINIVLPLKVIAIGCSAIFYITKRFPKLNPIAVFMVAIVYSLCGYAISSNTYVIWMDLLIYFPLAMLGFKRLIDTGSVKMHAIFSAALIYCSFSIASFSYFIIYPIYVIYVLMVVEKDKRKQVLTNIIISLVYAIIAALPILIPNLISVTHSSRNTSLFANLGNPAERNLRNMYTKLTYIFTDSIPLVLGIFYLIRDRKSKMAKFLMVAGVIIMAPVVVDECCFLLNMGSYNSYALRFGFLNAFFALFTCCMFLEKYDFKNWMPQGTVVKEEPTEQEPIVNTTKGEQATKEMTAKEALNSMGFVKAIKKAFSSKKIVFSVIATALLGGTAIYFAFLLRRLFYISDDITFAEDFYRGDDNYSFKGQFTVSEGGYNVIAWILLLALILCIAGVLLVKYKLITIKVLCCILAFFAVGQVSFYSANIVGGSRNTHNNTETIFAEHVNALKNGNYDFDYYRVKDYGWNDNGTWKAHMGSNVQLIYNTKQLNVFSSNVDQRAFTSSDYFNYTDSLNSPGTTAGEPHKKTILGDAFLGYRYYFMTDAQSSTDANASHIGAEVNLEVSDKTADWGAKYDSYGIYENTYALPLCFYTISDKPLEMKGVDYFEDMQALFEFVGGQGELFINRPFNQVGSGEFSITDSTIQIIPYKSIEGEYFVHFEFEDDIPIIETYGGNDLPISYKRYGKLGYTTQQSTSNWQTITIKRVGKLATMTDTELKAYLNTHLSLKIVDPAKLATLAVNARQRIIRFTETKDGVSFSIDLQKRSINLTGDQQVYVYLANNYLDNSYLKVNGNKVNPIDNPTGLTIFALGNQNNYSVKTGYVSPYPIIAIVVYIIASALAIGLTLLRRKTKFLQNATVQNVVYYSAITLAGIILAFFFIYPTTLTIDKFLFKVDLWKIIAPK